MIATKSPQERARFLDGLRGLAASVVVFHHVAAALFPFMVFGAAAAQHTVVDRAFYALPPLNLVLAGNFMVCVFFTLSGVALSYKCLKHEKRFPAISGLVRRYPRLAVPMATTTLCAWVLHRFGLLSTGTAAGLSGSEWLASFWHMPAQFGDALREGLWGSFASGTASYVPVLWTMRMELLGSLLVGAVMWVLPPRAVRMLGYLALAVLLKGSYLLGFVGGMAICDVWLATAHLRASWWRTAVFAPIGLYGLLLGSHPTPSSAEPGFYAHLLPQALRSQGELSDHVIGAICVVAAITAIPALRRCLEAPRLLWLGRVSFGLYLGHFLVLGLAVTWVLPPLAHVLPYSAAALLVGAGVIGASLTVARVFTAAVDEPTVRHTGTIYCALTDALRSARHRSLADRVSSEPMEQALLLQHAVSNAQETRPQNGVRPA